MKYTLKQRKLRYIAKRRKKLYLKFAPSKEQEKVIQVTKKLLVNPKTIMLCSAESEYGSNFKPRYIIRDEEKHITVKITYSKIRVINGVFKYDVSFVEGDRNLNDVRSYFSKVMERRLNRYDDEIDKDVNDSLDSIINDTLSD